MNFKHLYYFWRVAKAGGVVRAGELLHVTPQTISGQIGLLEDDLGTPLFAKRGRNLELTDAGQLAFGYAQDIFTLGSELQESLRNYPEGGRPFEFRVGVADAVPKTIAYRLIEPATRLPEPVRIVCREWKLDSLLSELAAHRLDLVIADAPIPPSVSVRAYNHRLGESGVSFFASAAVFKQCKGKFPACLDGAPMLTYGQDAPVRAASAMTMALSPASTRSMTMIAANAERNSMLSSSTKRLPQFSIVLYVTRGAAATPGSRTRAAGAGW